MAQLGALLDERPDDVGPGLRERARDVRRAVLQAAPRISPVRSKACVTSVALSWRASVTDAPTLSKFTCIVSPAAVSRSTRSAPWVPISVTIRSLTRPRARSRSSLRLSRAPITRSPAATAVLVIRSDASSSASVSFSLAPKIAPGPGPHC